MKKKNQRVDLVKDATRKRREEILEIIIVLIVLYFTIGRGLYKFVMLWEGNNISQEIHYINRNIKNDGKLVEPFKEELNIDNYLEKQILVKDIYDKDGYFAKKLDVSKETPYFLVDSYIENIKNNDRYNAYPVRRGIYISNLEGDIYYIKPHSYLDFFSPKQIFNNVKNKFS